MYQEFYNFSAEPFRLSPDHSFAYAHKGYTKARAYMDYAFMRAEGFVMITGRPGTGKTTLIGALLAELASTSVSIANLVCTQLQADDLLKLVAYEFGIPVSVVEKGELLQRLTQQLKSWHRDGRRALLIVDEAQDLSISAMEELRLLTNIQVDSRPLLQIFLLGQPELKELILSPRLEQVHQRIIAASHLRPLESDETEAYIRHRLETVHWQGNPAISKSVYPLIYKFSEGVPRRINLIFSRLLLHCAVEQRQQVAVADVREVVRELQEENLASGDSFAESDFQVADVFDDDIRMHTNTDTRTPAASRRDTAATVKAKTASGPDQNKEPVSVSVKPDEGGARAQSAATVRQDEKVEQQEVEVSPRKVTTGAGQAVRAPETLRTPAEKETLKSIRGRTLHRSSTAAGTGTAASTGRGGRNKTIPYRAAKTDMEDIQEGDADIGVLRRNARANWPKFVMLLVTFILLTYGPDLGSL
jgi:putative secretion ATPase (PEP-CTERM system associated)